MTLTSVFTLSMYQSTREMLESQLTNCSFSLRGEQVEVHGALKGTIDEKKQLSSYLCMVSHKAQSAGVRCVA